MNLDFECVVEVDGEECDVIVGVVVTHYHKTIGSYDYNAPSDVDYYGETELEWDVDVVAIRQFGSEEWEVLKDQSLIDNIINTVGETQIYNWNLDQITDHEPIHDDY